MLTDDSLSEMTELSINLKTYYFQQTNKQTRLTPTHSVFLTKYTREKKVKWGKVKD